MQHKVGTIFAIIDEIEGSVNNTFVSTSAAGHTQHLVPDWFGVLWSGVFQHVGNVFRPPLPEG
jgi:hypothetical protein